MRGNSWHRMRGNSWHRIDLRDAAPWGTELVLNLYGCDRQLIDDGAHIDRWVDNLVVVLGMKKFGKLIIEHFGHANPATAGYTAIQLIETSSLSAHFSPATGLACLNIFSCKDFDPVAAADLCAEMFIGRRYNALVIDR